MIIGKGFTVIVAVNGIPIQAPWAPDVGVTVYNMVCVTLLVLINAWLMELLAVFTFEAPVILAFGAKVHW